MVATSVWNDTGLDLVHSARICSEHKYSIDKQTGSGKAQ